MFTANQIVAHLIGDYILQNNWMAQKKLSDINVAILHALLYTIPFLLIIGIDGMTRPAFWVIYLSHAIIDRWRLGNLIIRIKEGKNGYPKEMPESLRIWLPIVQDNILHIVINGLAIYYL